MSQMATHAHYTVIHYGHTYCDGLHWLRHCPLCQSLLAQAEIATEASVHRRTHPEYVDGCARCEYYQDRLPQKELQDVDNYTH